MGLFDNVMNMKKDTAHSRPARPTSKKPTEKAVSAKAKAPITAVSIFGSLKRDRSVGTTPKTTPSTNVKKKKSPAAKEVPAEKPKEKRNWFRVSPKKDLNIKSSSTSSVNIVTGNNQQNELDDSKKNSKKIVLSTNITYRRGQNTKLDGQNIDNLSRTSSITNLDADIKTSKGAKPKKSASRDRLDKIGENKKNDKKSASKNNNKVETEDIPYPSLELVQEEEFLQLRRQLQEMAQEKTNLALQLGEQKGQLQSLQKEISKLKAFQEESNKELENLTEENTALRNRLRDVAHSPLSDTEKQQLLFDSHRQHSSAPASIATNLLDEGTGGDNTTCTTPDWDKHSSSDVSLACLQDKINQMQETHYSTNEELQATLQELTDLQRQLTELQQENERLSDEKNLMFDSLCRQTERLNDSRSEVESLKQLLYQEKDDGQFESAVEREQKLVALLKSAQEERENLLLKLEQLSNELQESRTNLIDKDDRIMHLSERVKTLEYTLDAKHAEHKLLDQDLAVARDQCSGKQIEINRLTDLLENARTKITELEQDRALSDKSELDELLDNARKEKDTLESEVAHLKKQLALSRNETEKLKEQVSILQEECKVTRNNARTTQSDLEYKCEKLFKEKNDLSGQIQGFQEALNELQVQSQCQLEDKRQLSAVLSETQRNLSEAERKNLSLENEMEELKKLREEENAEWEKFQSDLLTSVRVANDFKTEAQQKLEQIIIENKTFRERERQLQAELEKLKESTLTNRRTVSKIPTEPSNMDIFIKRRKHIPKQKLVTFDLVEEKVPKVERSTTTRKNLFPETLWNKPNKKEAKFPEHKPATSKVKKREGTASEEDRFPEHKTTMPKVKKRENTASEEDTFPEHTTIIPKVKKREDIASGNKRYKSLSVEEEHLLDCLNRRYAEIEKLPENTRTEVDNCIAQLKTIYDDENLKYKPVAHKPKDQLAISKPLLKSVLQNPKLRNIALNPKIRSTEDVGSFSARLSILENKFEDVAEKGVERKSVIPLSASTPIHNTGLLRSYSYGDIPYTSETNIELSLYRSVVTEDLTQDPFLSLRRSSMILPSDSASNFRQSGVISETQIDSRPPMKVSFSNLQSIVASIPPGTPESQLSKEQKFAVRLTHALDTVQYKNSLKRVKKSRKLKVSLPTRESVMRDMNLRKIMHSSNILQVPAKINPLHKQYSKSYEDISFSFDIVPINDRPDHGSPLTTNTSKTVQTKPGSASSSNTTLSNAEFDLDNYTIGPCSFEIDKENLNFYPDNMSPAAECKFETFKNSEGFPYGEDATVKTQSSNNTDLNSMNITDDLLYNVTLDKNVKHIGPVNKSSTDLTDDLLYNVTLDKNTKPSFKTNDNHISSQIELKSTVPNSAGISSNSIVEDELCTPDLGTTRDEWNVENVQLKQATNDIDVVLDRVQSINSKFSELHRLIQDDSSPHVINSSETLNNEQEHFDNTDSVQTEPKDSLPQNAFAVESSSNIHVPNVEYIEAGRDIIPDETNVRICNDTSGLSLLQEGGETSNFIKVCNALETDVETGEILKEKCFLKLRHSNSATSAIDEPSYYKNILRQNRYGVTTPLNFRFSYKDVVNEIDDAVHTMDEAENIVGHDEEGIDGMSLRPLLPEKIDSEMEQIFEQYLHVPVSKILSQSEGSSELITKEDPKVDLRDLARSLEKSVENVESISKSTTSVLNAVSVPSSESDSILKVTAYAEKTPMTVEVVDIDMKNSVSIETNVITHSSYLSKSDDFQFGDDLYENGKISTIDEIEVIPTNTDWVLETSPPSKTNMNFTDLACDNFQDIEQLELATEKQDNEVLPEPIGKETLVDDITTETMRTTVQNTSETVGNLLPVSINSSHIEKINASFISREAEIQERKPELVLQRESQGIDEHTEQNNHLNNVIMRRKKNVLPVAFKPDENTGKTEVKSSTTISQIVIEEDTSSKRLSFPTLDRKLLTSTKKVKSFAQHFENLSANQKKSQILDSNKRSKFTGVVSKNLVQPVERSERKPLPLPRKINQVNKNNDIDIKSDEAKSKIPQEHYTNFSDDVSYLNMSDNINNDNTKEIDDFGTLPKIVLEEYKTEITEGKDNADGGTAVEVRRSEKFIVPNSASSSSERQEPSNFDMTAEVCPSSIAVAGKFECLNLTASSDDTIEKIDTDSNLNLFNVESPSVDESYLNLFRSPEDTFYENISKKRNLKGFINVVCIEDQSDSGSAEKVEEMLRHDSKPKIIDFVPLDDDVTEPVFDKSVRSMRDSSEQGSSSNSVLDDALIKQELTNSHTNSPVSFRTAKQFFEELHLNNKIDIDENQKTPTKN